MEKIEVRVYNGNGACIYSHHTDKVDETYLWELRQAFPMMSGVTFGRFGIATRTSSTGRSTATCDVAAWSILADKSFIGITDKELAQGVMRVNYDVRPPRKARLTLVP